MGPRFEVFPSQGGDQPLQWYWRLVAANNEIVAQSEGYGSRSDAERGAKAAKRAALRARCRRTVTSTVIPETGEEAATE